MLVGGVRASFFFFLKRKWKMIGRLRHAERNEAKEKG
jgi:hypothetical protein